MKTHPSDKINNLRYCMLCATEYFGRHTPCPHGPRQIAKAKKFHNSLHSTRKETE